MYFDIVYIVCSFSLILRNTNELDWLVSFLVMIYESHQIVNGSIHEHLDDQSPTKSNTMLLFSIIIDAFTSLDCQPKLLVNAIDEHDC